MKIWSKEFSQDRNTIIYSYNGYKDVKICAFFRWDADFATGVTVNGVAVEPSPRLKTFADFKKWVGDNIDKIVINGTNE